MSRILNLKVVFFVAAVATILCAILIPRINANASTIVPATSSCVNNVHLLNGNNDAAKYNSSNSLWRSADSGTYTTIDICNAGSYDTIENTVTGDYMDYVSGTGVTETSDSSLARAHWILANCGSGYYAYKNAYIGSYLTGDAPGTSLYLSSPNNCVGDQEWGLTG